MSAKWERQPSLFDSAHSRWSDPDTSKAAGASISYEALTRTQGLVLAGLKMGPATDEELIARFRSRWSGCKVSEQSIRSRRSELVRRGTVRATGVRRRTEYGQMATVWEVVNQWEPTDSNPSGKEPTHCVVCGGRTRHRTPEGLAKHLTCNEDTT